MPFFSAGCWLAEDHLLYVEIAGFVERHAPDELILTGQIHDHAARLRSFEIAAEALGQGVTPEVGAAC